MPDEKLARALRAKIRRQILCEISRNGKMSVHQIAKKLGVTEYTASRHLKILYDLGIVDFEMRPPEKYYFIRLKSFKKLLDVYEEVTKEMKMYA
ncbi:transcriptional regulator, ArsR family [Archaeoglobus sulfaticallidus PM70-1]|uniref:Transcriptional regulator, ArsR family n=1 Tax=Archaeoglobus sulfaticallidus PM70-1 TaxID=387631 RepID=N0BEI4_9EURY|nr:winged helix-turn-helix domain-containing protein [Archaeoglobus sulfaticallidus]AGK62024.1 transcriptional regulator, ArsR family [Archaeoglobus sulfaticallidus PM70-1]